MTVEIQDDFDLEKIRKSGQCFRVHTFPGGCYRFITGREVLYITPMGRNLYEISCDETVWETVWEPYFSLNLDYRKVREREKGKNPYIDRAMEYSSGLRILRQDPSQMTLANWQKFCFGMLDLAKRQGWK